jgi:hypothetical protein
MTTTFENAKVGDKVWDFVYEWGEVAFISKSAKYPLTVTFSRGQESYTYEGTSAEGNKATLFWDEIKFETPRQSARKKLILGVELPDIYKNESDLCYSQTEQRKQTAILHANVILRAKTILGIK